MACFAGGVALALALAGTLVPPSGGGRPPAPATTAASPDVAGDVSLSGGSVEAAPAPVESTAAASEKQEAAGAAPTLEDAAGALIGERAGGRSPGRASEKDEVVSRVAPFESANRLEPPDSRRLTLTVPEMGVSGAAVRTAPVSGEGEALRSGVLHPSPSGYPWHRRANVYLAAHRVGYPGTPSEDLFAGIDRLQKGDRIQMADSAGRRYVYRVTKRLRQ